MLFGFLVVLEWGKSLIWDFECLGGVLRGAGKTGLWCDWGRYWLRIAPLPVRGQKLLSSTLLFCHLAAS